MLGHVFALPGLGFVVPELFFSARSGVVLCAIARFRLFGLSVWLGARPVWSNVK